MTPSLTGSWIAVRSEIPGYESGNEWLCFSANGEHRWIVGQRPGAIRPPVTTLFALEGDGARLRFHPCAPGRVAKPDDPLTEIEILDRDEIRVIAPHGFCTVFRREAPETFPQPSSAAAAASTDLDRSRRA